MTVTAISPVRTRGGTGVELRRHLGCVEQVEHDEPIEHRFEAPLTLAELVGSGVRPRAQALLHPADERVNETEVAGARLVGRPDHAQHLLPERKVLADDIADASAHGDAAGRRLGFQATVIGAINAATAGTSEFEIGVPERSGLPFCVFLSPLVSSNLLGGGP